MAEEYALRFAEYTVSKKACGKNLLLRVLFILSYILFAIAYCVIFLVVLPIPQVIAILPFLEIILVFFTWQLVRYDLSVCLDSSRFTVTRIRFKKKRVLFEAPITSVEAGGPMSELPAGIPVRDFRSAPNVQNSRFLVFGGTAIVFEATKKLIATVRYYKPDAARNDDNLPF